MEPTPSVVVLGDTLAILSPAVIHSPRHPRLEDVGRASLYQSVQSEVAALGLAPGDTVIVIRQLIYQTMFRFDDWECYKLADCDFDKQCQGTPGRCIDPCTNNVDTNGLIC